MGLFASIKSKDFGLNKLKALVQQARVKDGPSVKVGVLSSGKGGVKRKGLTVAEIAVVHEFGTKDGKIPERSFMRSTMLDNKTQYATLTQELLIRVFDNRLTFHKALQVLGLRVSSDMRKKITVGGVKPGLAASTLARRVRRVGAKRAKKVTVLFDTGQLVRAITYAVET
jgi:hypothetical protein